MVDTVEELQEALADPAAFFEKLATEIGGPVAKKMLIVQLKPRAKPYLERQGLTFEDVLPALEMVDTVEELQGAAADPAAFFEKLATEVGGPAAKKMLIAKLKPRAKPYLAKQGLTFEDVLPALEMVDSPEELQEAFWDPAAFFEKLATEVGGPVAK